MRVVVLLVTLVLVSGVALTNLDTSTDGGSSGPSAAATPSTVGSSPEEAPTSDRPTPPPVASTLVMWSRGELSAEVAQRAAGLPHVTATAFVRSETVGLVGARDADGRPVESLTDGWRIPVDVVAVDPAPFAATLPEGRPRDVVADLQPGQALLPESGARLRRLGVGGTIDLDGRPGLEVVAVVPDGTVRNAEMVLHAADADAVGLDPDGSVVVRHTAPDETATQELRDSLRALAPEDRPARVVDLTGGADRHRAPLVLSLLEVKSRFGEFAFQPRAGVREISVSDHWVDQHIVTADVPILGSVRCHERIIEDLRAGLQEIVRRGLAGTIDPEAYAGCYYPRLISADRDRLSRHSWGIALDINVDPSAPGLGPPPPPEVVEILGRHGFRWGGDFLHPDNHHFEWIGEEAVRRPER